MPKKKQPGLFVYNNQPSPEELQKINELIDDYINKNTLWDAELLRVAREALKPSVILQEANHLFAESTSSDTMEMCRKSAIYGLATDAVSRHHPTTTQSSQVEGADRHECSPLNAV